MRLGILGGNVYVDFLISGIVELPAAFLILITIERIGRRLPFATANFVAGAACLITAFIPNSGLPFGVIIQFDRKQVVICIFTLNFVSSTGMFWLKSAVACVGRLGITMAFEMVVFVNTELYPTVIR